MANEFIVKNGIKIPTETASTVPYLDANKKLVSSDVTPTELDYLDGVSSNIQTQLDSKASSSSVTDHLNDTADAHDASAISSVAAGNLAATTVQAALDELQTDIDTRATSNSPTLTTPSIDIITLDGQASTPANPSAGNYKVYVKDATQKLTVLDSTGAETTVGTGSGGGATTNYIASSDGTAIGDWATYDDGASSSPVDGTGGSPGATFAVSTSSTMRSTSNFLFTHDAADRQGEGFSYLMAIDPSDRGKVLRLSFDYLVASGTYADDGMAVWFYDVTNAALIQPAPYLIKNSSLIERFNCEVQVPSSCASLRVIFHVTTTTATAYTIRFDDFNFGPQAKLYGSPMTDWVSYTPTTTNVGTATFSALTGRWRRVGDSAEIVIAAVASGAGSGASAFTFSFPSGLVGDAVKYASGLTIGTANHYSLEAASQYDTSGAGLASTTTIAIANNGSGGNFTGADIRSDTQIYIKALIPIVGWSSSLVMSSDADTRVVAATMYRTSSNQTIASASETLVQLNAASPDTVGGANISTYRYTVQVPGNYAISAVVRASSLTANESLTVRIKQSGTSIIVINADMSNAGTASSITVPTRIVSATTGQYFELYVQSASDTSYDVVGTADSFTYMSIQRISGPAQIAASEVIVASYFLTSNLTINTSVTDIAGLSKYVDSHNAMNATTGVYTFPISGTYELDATLRFDTGGSAATQHIITTAGIVSTLGAASDLAASKAYNYYPTLTFRALAGDTIKLQGQSVTNSSTAIGSQNFISIKRIGNY